MVLEVIIGPMFSGKTTELIRLIEREIIAKRRGAIFKPSFDKRYSEREVVTHNGIKYKAYQVVATPVGITKIKEICDKKEIYAVGVDEVQFFPEEIVDMLDSMAYERKVIVCGLNLSFRAEPFKTTMMLAAKADKVTYLSAVCVKCGKEATRTQRLISGKPAPLDSPLFVVGGKELYEPRCRNCYEKPK